MPIESPAGAKPLDVREPVIIGMVVVGAIVGFLLALLSDWLGEPEFMEAAGSGFFVGECLLAITLAGLMGRFWLAAYTTALLIMMLWVGASWLITFESLEAMTGSMWIGSGIPLLLLISAAPTFGMRQFLGLRLARVSEMSWSRTPLGIGDVFSAMALAGALLVFGRVSLATGYMTRNDLWGMGMLGSIVGVGMGTLLAIPAIWSVFMVQRLRWKVLGLLAAPLVVAAGLCLTALLTEDVPPVAQLLEGIGLLALLSMVAGAFYYTTLWLLYARGYRLLRVPYAEPTDTPKPRWHASRWVIGAVVVAAVVTNAFLSPLEEAHQRQLQAQTWVMAQGGYTEVDSRGEVYVVHFEDVPLRDEELEGLETLASVTSLNLTRTGITDAGLEHVAQLHALRELFLGSTPVTDQGLLNLSHLPTLTRLQLNDTDVTGEAFAEMESRATISHLDLSDAAVTDAGCRGIGQLSVLTTLDLSNAKITDEGLAHLTKLNYLRSLKLGGTAVRGSPFAQFEAMPFLGSLDLAATPCGDDVSHLFSLCPALVDVDLSRTAISDAALAKLNGHAALLSLDLSETSVTDRGLGELKTLPELRSLFLSHTQVTGAFLKDLAAPELASLALRGTQCTDDTLAHFRRFPFLDTVSLSETLITDGGIAHLAGESFNLLEIEGTPITAAGLLGAKLRIGRLIVRRQQFTVEELTSLETVAEHIEEVAQQVVSE